MQRYAKSAAGQTYSNSVKAVKGGNQYLCLHEKVSLLRHRQFCGTDTPSLAWSTSRVVEHSMKMCGLWKCVNSMKMCGLQQDLVTWKICQEASADMSWEVNKSHSNQIALNIFGSTRTDLALNVQRRLNTSVHNAKVIYICHWSFL